MKFKIKLKQIFACIALIVAILASCSFQTLGLASEYIAVAQAKAYEAKNKVDPYEFTTTSQWNQNTNYSSQTITNGDESTSTVNAFKTTSSSVNIVDLEKANKPSIKWDESTTAPAEGDEATIDNYVMMITADNAETKQYKDKKDDNGKTVYNKEDFVMENDDVKYFETVDTNNSKYLPVDQTLADSLSTKYPSLAENIGKYVEMKPEQELKDIYYYYKSNSLSFTKQTYYVVSFWMYTYGDAEASVRVATSDGKKFDASIEELSSDQKWTKVYFFLETRAIGSTPTVYISLYFGNLESIAGSNQTDANVTGHVTGTVYFDNLTVQTINQTDFLQQTINGKTPTETNVVIDSYSARTDSYYSNLIKNAEFEDTSAINGYKNTNADNSNWKYFVPEFDLSDAESDTPTLVKNMYKDVYASSAFEISNPLEAEELKLFDLDEDGNKKYAPEDTEKESPLMINGYSTFDKTGNNHILKIKNTNQSYDLGLISNEFNIDQFAYYRISFWVKATDENSSATVAVFGNIKTGKTQTDGTYVVKTQTITDLYTEETDKKDDKDETMDMNNGWTEVVFFVHGNAYRDMSIQLVLLANTNSTVYFDHIAVESVLSSDFSSASSTYKLELSPSSMVTNKSITNGYFNSIATEDYDKSEIKAPYKAQNWTLGSDNDDKVVAGIVPTNDKYDEIKDEIGGYTNPNGNASSSTAKTNVYAIYSPAIEAEELEEDEDKTGRNFKLSSSSFSLSSNSVYKVKVNMFVCSGVANFTGKINISLTYSDSKIAEFTIDGATVEKSEWLEYTFLVRTGASSRSTTITIELEDSLGTLYFKNIGLYQLKETERIDEAGEKIKVSPDELFEEKFAENTTDAQRLANKTYVVDYVSYNFTMHSNEKVTETIKSETEGEDDTIITKDYYESFSHKVVMKDEKDTAEKKTHGIVGVIDTTGTVKLSDTQTLSSLTNEHAKTDKALLIYNATELDTSVTSKVTYSLSKDSFYTIEVYVKTGGFADNNGLKIAINAIGVTFDKIDTTQVQENNGYELYRAIVRTGDESISGLSIDFTLGTASNKVAGYAIVSDINITKLADLDAYNEVVDAVEDTDTKTQIKNFYLDSEADTESTPTDTDTLTIFFLVFSSILLVVTLVIALIALAVKKHPKKKVVKVDESENNFKAKKPKQTETPDSDKGGFV